MNELDPDPVLIEQFILADQAAREAAGTTSPNPAVGAVIVDQDGMVIGVGATQPPGGKHAEIVAIEQALRSRPDLRGCGAVVTLEPCNHTGRTGPCAQALIDCGISQVDYLFADPFHAAAGGARTLAKAGVKVRGPYLAFPISEQLGPLTQRVWTVEPWLTSVVKQRPHVVIKFASTVDGRVAAVDGSSQWITGAAARHAVHADRCRRDALIVGTGTVLADDPRLTARAPDGTNYPEHRQPRRVVMGNTPVPPHAAIRGDDQKFIQIEGQNIRDGLSRLYDDGVVSVLVEGGASLLAAYLAEGLVDEVHAYIAPALLGGGLSVFSTGRQGSSTVSLGSTLADIRRFVPRSLTHHGNDIQWILTAPGALES